MAFSKTITLKLAAASTNGIAQSQSLGSPGNFNLNGGLVTAGVATLDSGGASRVVLFTFASDETGHNFIVTGTDRYGRTQTETVAGTASTATTVKDFTTVTQVSGPTTIGNVQIGTNGTGSSEPWIVDQWANPQTIGVGVTQAGAATWSIQEAYDDLSPNWDVNANAPNWFNDANLTAKTSTTNASLAATAFTMVRLTITSGTQAVTARFIQNYVGVA